MFDITLSSLPGGAARVLRWLAAEGATVEAGAPLAVVLTEQAEVALPAPAAGALIERIAEGVLVAPGGLLARLRPAAGAAPTEAPSSARPRATPLARSIARAHGLDLAAIAGSHAHDRIRAADVRALIPLPSTAPAGAQLSNPPIPQSPVPQSPVPQSPIAAATFELDATAALALADRLAERLARHAMMPPSLDSRRSSEQPSARRPAPAVIGLLARVVEAAAALLPLHPLLNARWGDEAIVLRRRAHVAAAAPGDGGALCWSLVCDAGDLTMRGVARALAASPAARLDSATFAVVCLAPGVAWHSAPPPLPGTAAALCVGAPERRAAALGERVAVRPMAMLTLSYDARVLDHRHAAAFLCALTRELERGG